jgi:hypothetical protein
MAIIHQSLIQPGGPTNVDVGEAEGQMAVCTQARQVLSDEIHRATEDSKSFGTHPWLNHPINTLFTAAELLGIVYSRPAMFE